MSTQSKQILFSLNTLFWVSMACLEAPISILETSPSNQNLNIVLQQIQFLGMLGVRRTLEETNFVKILFAFQNISDVFFSYNLKFLHGITSFT